MTVWTCILGPWGERCPWERKGCGTESLCWTETCLSTPNPWGAGVGGSVPEGLSSAQNMPKPFTLEAFHSSPNCQPSRMALWSAHSNATSATVSIQFSELSSLLFQTSEVHLFWQTHANTSAVHSKASLIPPGTRRWGPCSEAPSIGKSLPLVLGVTGRLSKLCCISQVILPTTVWSPSVFTDSLWGPVASTWRCSVRGQINS